MKHVVLGISSSIAAYKAIELIKKLIAEDIVVSVIFTTNALKLVNRQDFEVVIPNKTYTNTFRKDYNYQTYLKDNKSIDHINLADSADLFVVVPATANVIGKFANGIADDLLTTTFLATDCQKLIAPAMNCKMWDNPIMQQNIFKLKEVGIDIIDPASGELACGYEGVGRLEDLDIVTRKIYDALDSSDEFRGKKILVTAGPTHEEIDPVRYISNKSSGKMGYSIAKAAKSRGAQVVLITGPTELVRPCGVQVVEVTTAAEMKEKVFENSDCDVFISAAAVADYKVNRSEEKIKKTDFITLDLEKNPDILFEFSKIDKSGKILVGFALETNDIVKNAKEKLEKKGLDLIIANGVNAFGSEKNSVYIIDKKGNMIEYKEFSKISIANKILDAIYQMSKCL